MAGLGGDKEAYLERVRALRDEISAGTREIDTMAVDPRLITENEEVIFAFVIFLLFPPPPSFSSMLQATLKRLYTLTYADEPYVSAAYADVC